MFRPSQTPTSSSAVSWKDQFEGELAAMSPGQRRFFELMIGITRVLFVPVWLILCAGWAGRCLVLTLAGCRSASPRRALPPPPGFERLNTSGYGLYIAGAYVAVALGLISMIGLCFLPVLTVFWVFLSSPPCRSRRARPARSWGLWERRAWKP